MIEPHPFDWLFVDRLGVCVHPMVGEQAAAQLASSHIGLLINLHERANSPELIDRIGARSLHMPVPNTFPPTQAQLDEGVAAIAEALAGGERVVVHCGAGLGRSGTLLAAFLVFEEGCDAEQAMRRVRAARPGAIETLDQEQAIREYARRRGHAL